MNSMTPCLFFMPQAPERPVLLSLVTGYLGKEKRNRIRKLDLAGGLNWDALREKKEKNIFHHRNGM